MKTLMASVHKCSDLIMFSYLRKLLINNIIGHYIIFSRTARWHIKQLRNIFHIFIKHNLGDMCGCVCVCVCNNTELFQ